LCHLEQFCCLNAAVSGKDVSMLIGQYGRVKAKSLDTLGNSSYLSGAVFAGIMRNREEIGEIDDLKMIDWVDSLYVAHRFLPVR
jgi:hypothetical protein